MGVTVMPPAAVNLADNPKNRLYRATQSGTYTVSIPAGVYEVQRQATTNIIIGSTTLSPSTTLQVLFVNEPQTSITFNSTVSTDVVPWLEGPITDNGTQQQYGFRPEYLSEIDLFYSPSGYMLQFWTSTDAITWTSRTRAQGQISPFGAPSYVAKKPGAGNFYVQAYFSGSTNAGQYTSYSTNGILWSQSSNRIFDTVGESGNVVLFGANTFLLAGYYWRTGANYDAIVALSTNGVTWDSRQVLMYSIPSYLEYFYSGAFGAGVFVLGTNQGTMRTSTDGLTWTVRDPRFGGNQISNIKFAAGRFLAGGGTGTLRTSTDSITWTNVNSGIGVFNINTITYDDVNGVWSVMSDATATIRSSTDLVTWVSRSSAVNQGVAERAIAFGKGLYFHGYTDTNTRARWFRTANILTMSPSVPFTDTYIILEYKGTTRTLS